MNGVQLDREGGYIYIRNFPFPIEEVIRIQEETGGQLFDESCFIESHKKRACAQVIRALDIRYHHLSEALGKPPQRVELVGDPSWTYIPVDMFAGTHIQFSRTQDRPSGKFIAWFRARKVHSLAGNHRRRDS